MPVVSGIHDSLRVAVGYAFVVALLVLGLIYMLAALIRLDMVSPRNAITFHSTFVLSVAEVITEALKFFSFGLGIFIN